MQTRHASSENLSANNVRYINLINPNVIFSMCAVPMPSPPIPKCHRRNSRLLPVQTELKIGTAPALRRIPASWLSPGGGEEQSPQMAAFPSLDALPWHFVGFGPRLLCWRYRSPWAGGRPTSASPWGAVSPAEQSAACRSQHSGSRAGQSPDACPMHPECSTRSSGRPTGMGAGGFCSEQ